MAYIDKELFEQDIKMRYCNNCARPNEIKCRACHVDDLLGEIEDAPTADVVEVKHGEWKNFEMPHMMRCSECGVSDLDIHRKKFAFCPYCGTKMDGRSDT